VRQRIVLVLVLEFGSATRLLRNTMPWVKRCDRRAFEGKRSEMSRVFATRHLRLGHAASLLRRGNRGRGLPAVGYVLEPRPTKVEDEDDDEGRGRLRLAAAPLLAPSSLLYRNFPDVDVHLTVCAFSNVFNLERTVAHSGNSVSFLRYGAAPWELYDNPDARSLSVA
jgi:hypothetical protein